MIKIKLISRMAGPEGNFAPGSILDVEKNVALDLVNGGHAELLEPLPIEAVTEVIEEVSEVNQEVNEEKLSKNEPIATKKAVAKK